MSYVGEVILTFQGGALVYNVALRHEEEFVEIFECSGGWLVNGGDYGLPLVARQFVENLDDP